MTSVLSAHDGSTQIRFEQHATRANVAQCSLLLSNISQRSLYYVLKCSNDACVTAKSSCSGRLSAQSSRRLSLIWRRPSLVDNWREVVRPRIVLLTHFVDSGEIPSRNVTATRLRAFIQGDCGGGIPPSRSHTEQLLLDTAVSPSGGSHVRLDVRGSTRSSPSNPLTGRKRRSSDNLSDPFAQQYNQVSNNAKCIFAVLLFLVCVVLWRNASHGLGGIASSKSAAFV